MNDHDRDTAPDPAPGPNLADADHDLRRRVDELQAEVARLRHAREIDERLIDADVADLESARVLTERTLTGMDEPNVDQAIDELRRRKPWLFTRRHRSAGALSPHATDGTTPHAHALADAADRAGATGRRGDLLRYLRLRRSAG